MEFESEEDYWSHAFDTFDANSDGGIDSEELEYLMQICKLNPTKETVAHIMQQYSTTGTQYKEVSKPRAKALTYVATE